MNAEVMLRRAILKFSPLDIASALGLHANTVRRWLKQRRVPEHYLGDLCRLLGENGTAEDQFYTKPEVARRCYDTFKNIAGKLRINLSRYRFVEPSAGRGGFYRLLPKDRRIGIDLKPMRRGIIERDYLLWEPRENSGRCVVVGNPPFGLRGHLALRFINHSATFADMVAFILPQLFESDGKGVPAKRVDERLRLAHSERLAPNSFEKPDGSPVEISTIFQVWTRINHHLIEREPRRTCRRFMRVFSVSDGGTPSSTRNKNMIGKCDLYLPSTCFAGMKTYKSFPELPNQRGYGIVALRARREIVGILRRHDWRETAFVSTNGALNLRRSLIENVLIKEGYHDAR